MDITRKLPGHQKCRVTTHPVHYGPATTFPARQGIRPFIASRFEAPARIALLILAGMPEKAVNNPMPVFTPFAPGLLDHNAAEVARRVLQAMAA
jgi:hypothetical protein